MKIIGYATLNQNMAPIPCSAPDCAFTFQENLDPQVLLALIEMHSRTAHAAAPNTQPSVKPESIKRPSLSSAGTEEEFTYFKQRWTEYKQATKLQGKDVLFQLLECCDDALRKDLSRTSVGNLTDKTEENLIKFIKPLAVRKENHLVARVELQQLRQDREEPVRAFCARLRGQAGVCQFIKKCSCDPATDVDYSDEMIRDCLIRNIEDQDIRLDVLGQADQDQSLEDILQLIEAKESGKRSASRLLNGNTVTSAATTATSAATNSSYRRQKSYPRYNRQQPTQRQEYRNQSTGKYESPSSPPSTHCGRNDHSGNLKERMKSCPAYNKQCPKCSIHHHLPSVCRSQRPQQRNTSGHNTLNQDAINQEESLFVYNTLCEAANDVQITQCSSITLDHHVYENLCKTWTKRRSDPQPNVNVSVTFHPSDATDLNLLPPDSSPQPPSDPQPAMPDTGCQACLSGVELLQKLNFRKSDLYPVSMSMTAVNNNHINIIGALPLRISGVSPSGSTCTTRQIVYFADNTNKLFLSKQACAALGIIS